MPRKYVGRPLDTMGGEHVGRAEVSLVGSHLQNICIEVEGDGVDVSIMLSPGGTQSLIATLQLALDEVEKQS